MFWGQDSILRCWKAEVNHKLTSEGKALKIGAYPARLLSLVLLPLAVQAVGCNSEDADRMARVGHKVLEKAEALAPEADGRLSRGWQAMRSGLDGMPLDARVTARLRWDKTLAEAEIQVSMDGGVVELKGSVRDAAQRQRAVELAESTAGVEKVTDSLETPTQQP